MYSIIISIVVITSYRLLSSSENHYEVWALHNLRLRAVCEGLGEDGAANKLCYDPEYVSGH